ncbi:dynamin family protein [Staphylococcus sp. 17KM0847]|uniref:dynamin family protein n=1 Tax=Staphylococcus sp. 17KM0847 TaxID=2583989 RepID=UPI0015DD2D27|nr:dynamin family protein [Staphylococcus sp. 17KM0847]QLK86169.1 GTP-binding protein [Staphylococcus sp. 17KM0847]
MKNIEQLDILYKLKKEVEKSDHHAFVHTINQIIKKVYLEHYTLTFVGHFSAGKSTIINNLIGQDILPSSPVPTTSNTALVTVAEESGITANIEGQRYTELTSYDEVKQMNKENYNVESIDVRFLSTDYRLGLTFQDTPGVDSNVASHSVSAERFLYTSNIVFYTVDYNHVQSALNFQFMKRLNQADIPVVFIINQIDKHNDDELSFDTFKSRVEKSLADWDITLVELFYITKFQHPENQLNALKNYIHTCDEQRESMEDYVSRMVQFIQSTQARYLSQQMAQCLERLNIEPEQFDKAFEQHLQQQSASNEAQLISDKQALRTHLHDKRKTIIDNAYIMSHDMRERIRYYLESMTKDFSVGGLFNKRKKTEQAQNERLSKLMEALQEQVNQEIIKPIQIDMAFLTRFITDSELNSRILNQSITLPSDLVTSLYQTQVQISNQYVLTFSEDLMKRIRQYILKDATTLDEAILSNVQVESDTLTVNEETDDYQHYQTLRTLKTSLETKNYQHYYIHLDDSLDQLIDRTVMTYTPGTSAPVTEQALSQHITHTKRSTPSRRVQIEQALDIIDELPLYDTAVNTIKQALARMSSQVIKIGVFGTFSAGKSSLINALLGDHYLVSSPNPTTAATTEISYGTNNAVTFKTNDELLDELNHVVEIVGYKFNTISEFLTADKQALKHQIDKDRLAFIEAIEKNYTYYQQLTETSYILSISQEDIKKWSAEDEYATFVKTVHIQLEHPWLKDKIIVDSLGLYSNNQRHTNETEKILASSDLILYVSYFNHSFTDNDRAFIQHMKEMNQLIENQAFKMVINATDLAETAEDLEAVHHYVTSALSEAGMSCEVFGVSSREALRQGDQGLSKLRTSIETFASIDAKYVLESQIVQQLQSITDALEVMVTDFQTNHEQIKQNHLHLQKLASPHVFNHRLIDAVKQQYMNELEDQLYYLNERLNIQLLDDVKSVFNGQMTVIDDFKVAKRNASKLYLDQIHQKLYLEQTLLVTRMKNYFETQLQHQLTPILTQLSQLHVILQADTHLLGDEVDTPYLHIQLEDFIHTLPKSLTKKRILQVQYQKQVHPEIKDITLSHLEHGCSELKAAMITLNETLATQAHTQLAELEVTAQHHIQNVLDFKLDASLIEKLNVCIPKLKNILEVEDTNHV